MSVEWYLIKPPRIFNSGFENDEFDNYALDGFNELLTTFIAEDVIVYNNTKLDDGREIRAIVQNVTTDNVNNADIRQVICNIGLLHSGQYVEYKNRYWLILTLPDDNKVYEKAIMLCCNHYLQWINDNDDVVGCYCIALDETKYTVGVKEQGVNVLLGDMRFNITIPRDEETLKLSRGKRFLISNNQNNPNAYKLTRMEDVTSYYISKDISPFQDYSGVANLVCVEDQFNALTDNAELMIADYYSVTTQYKLQLLNHNVGTPLLLDVGNTFKLDVLATKDGEVVSGDNISFRSASEDIVLIDDAGQITAVGEGFSDIIIDFFSEEIVVNVEVLSGSSSDIYAISIIDNDNDLQVIYGDKNAVTIKTYKNGIEDNDIFFEYELIGADGIADIQSVIDNIITIYALNNTKNVNKIFTLRVWNSVLGIEDNNEFKVVGYF